MLDTKFSIVIPTYTGQDDIADCFTSILSQQDIDRFSFDVIVVIDGPNTDLEKIVESQISKFKKLDINFSIFKFSKNKGRFEARLKGANESSNDYVLFLDDRNILAKDYLSTVLTLEKEALIPNVIEEKGANFVSNTLNLLRQNFYGNKWGRDFSSYYIYEDNFEKSSKGTTSFWINRAVFIEACKYVVHGLKNSKDISDDTKILKRIIELGFPLYKASEVKLYYRPRKKALSELKHIYSRGPKFIDYYLKPGTRFFHSIILLYLLITFFVAILFIYPPLGLYFVFIVLLSILIFTFLIKKGEHSRLSTFLGVLFILSFFSAGVFVGQIKKIGHYISNIGTK